MNENIKYIAAAVAVVGATIGGILYVSRGKQAEPVTQPVTAITAPHAAPEEPAIKHPLPAASAEQALPALDESDAVIQGSLNDLLGSEFVKSSVITKDLVRHIVVTVDNIPEQKVAERVRPVKAAPGAFVVSGTEDAPVLDPANYERYKPLVQVFRSTDNKVLIAAYTRYYPLFQSAYADLGHPPQYFNDRLVEVIDHLLATPDVHDPVPLARPNVQFEYADPKLEALSAGQKVLIRMGSANAAAVKAKLRELRGELIATQPGG